MARRDLIFDADKWIAMSTSMILEAEGFAVHSALSGAEGIEMAREIAPSIILLDIMMPGIDGWETLERLKEEEDLPDIPVIVFTAREHSQGRAKSRNLGAVEYFRKPFRPEVLIQTIRKHLQVEVEAPAAEC